MSKVKENIGTVLVLGAGASTHYGYPTGDGLIEKIIRIIEANKYDKKHFMSVADYNTLSFLLKTYDPTSIDTFLGREVKRRPNIIKAGKEMIAWTLFSQENGLLFERDIEEQDTSILDGHEEWEERYDTKELNIDDLYRLLEPHFIKKNERGNWYRFLWQAMMAGKEDGQKVVENPGIHIITFNYDLSLEVALVRWIAQTDFFDSEQKINFIKEMESRIIHPYGRIRNLCKNKEASAQEQYDEYSKAHNEYGKFQDKTDQDKSSIISEAINNIYVMNEERTNITEQKGISKVAENFNIAQDWLSKAKRVYFLGFGFDDTNISENGLNLKKILGTQGSNKNCEIFTTNFNNHTSIKIKLEKVTKKSVLETKNLLREHAVNGLILSSEKNVYRALSEDFPLILS